MSKGCSVCGGNIPFQMPDEIIEACIKGELIIFAGGGVSTEKKGLMPFSFYEDVCDELGINPKESTYPFSELMTLFCSKPNGRRELLKLIRTRIDYCKSFGQLRTNVTKFHNELSQIHLLQNIITTNWDTFFEDACNAQSFVSAEDFAFYNYPGRKVFKIHGSMTNLSSIIATKEDYDRCYRSLNKGVLGANLKLLLATKTVVFIGYSLRDEDFTRIYKLLKKEYKGLLPHSYIVKPSSKIDEEYKDFPLNIIETDGTFFIHKLKESLIEKHYLFSPEKIDGFLSVINDFIGKIHYTLNEDFQLKSNPNLLYTLMYQDGMIDFLTRYSNLKGTGDYYCPEYIKSNYDMYESIRKNKIKSKQYIDIAYIDGYKHMLFLILLVGVNSTKEASKYFRPFYIYGAENLNKIKTEKQFTSNLKKVFHKGAYKYAENYIETIGDNIPQHTAFLY